MGHHGGAGGRFKFAAPALRLSAFWVETFRLRFAALLGRKSPSPGIREGWCSPVRFYASGDQVAGTEFRHRGWWHPRRYERSGCGRGTDPLLRSARPTRYWPTGHLPAHQDYGLFTGQEHGVQAAPDRRSPPRRPAGRTIVSSAWKDSVPPIITHGLTQRYRTARLLELDQATDYADY